MMKNRPKQNFNRRYKTRFMIWKQCREGLNVPQSASFSKMHPIQTSRTLSPRPTTKIYPMLPREECTPRYRQNKPPFPLSNFTGRISKRYSPRMEGQSRAAGKAPLAQKTWTPSKNDIFSLNPARQLSSRSRHAAIKLISEVRSSQRTWAK